MPVGPTAALLARLFQAGGVTETDRRVVADLVVEERSYRAGDVLIERGEPTEPVFLMIRGWAAHAIDLSEQRRQVLGFMLPGDLSDLPTVEGELSDRTLQALMPIHVALLDREGLMGLFCRPGTLSDRLWLMVAQERGMLREHAVRNGRRSARERVAHLLLEIYERLRRVGEAGGDRFQMPIGQAHLADALSLSYVHVSRVLGQLEREGLIERNRSEMFLKSREELEALSGFSPLYMGPASLDDGDG